MAVRTESMNGMYLEGSYIVHTCSLGMVINTTPAVSCQAVGWGSKSEWHDIFLSELRIMKLVNPELQVPIRLRYEMRLVRWGPRIWLESTRVMASVSFGIEVRFCQMWCLKRCHVQSSGTGL